MTNTKKILVSLLALAACGNLLQAQDVTPRHEVSATIQGLGLGSMPFKGGQSWNDQPGLSLGFGVGYTYWFNNHFGIRTGLRMNRFSFNQKISNYDVSFSSSLPMSSLGLPGGSGMTTVNMNAKASSIQEEQQYTFVELPLMLAMRCHQWYLNLGISLAKAVNATADYSYNDPSCAITELPDLGVTLTTPVPMTFNGEKEGNMKNRDMPKPFYCLLAAEAGYNIPVGEATNLSVGLFGRLAPVASKTKNDVEAYSIHTDATFQVAQPSTSTLVEKKGYYEVGVSLGVNFGITNRKKQSDEQPILNSGNPYADATATELAAAKAAREEAESELAAAKAAREKAESELAALEAARKKAEADIDAYRKSVAEQDAPKNEEVNAKQNAPKQENTPTRTQSAVEDCIGKILFNFDYNKSMPNYNDETEVCLRALCGAMQKDQNLKVVVIGHTDNVGTKRNNIAIGLKRAYAVKKLMVDLGAPAENIDVATRGEDEPKESNMTKEGRALNRRATVELR